MIYFESIVVIVLSLCTIAPYASEEVNDVSETIRLVAPNCAISGLRNEQGDRSENVRTRIIIENCSNPSIPSSAFAHLNNIVSIDIIGSDVSAIDANAFDGLNVLERLSLTSNNLTTFHVWSNENLDAVTTLDLSLNQVRELEVNALRPYPNLEYLSLAFNWIAEIPIGFFGKISSIQTLHLDGNSIHRIEAETFKPLLLLEQLYLENNEISFIDKFAFSTLAHLKSMRLDGNQITALEPTLFFASPRLQQLNLSHNTLDALTMTFQENVELKVIDLSYNSISTLQSDALEGVESLEIFNISHNRLRSIEPSAFEDFVRVKYLDVSNNELTGLRDNQLTYLESIEYLNLSNNFIDTIQPFTFTDLRTLRTIDLSHNHLDSDTFVQKIDELQLLDLTANRYRSIDIAAFARIKEVKLIGNLWSCSWLVTELVNSTAIVRDDVHFGTKLTSIDGNAIVGIRQPEEVICYDIGNAAQESNYLFPRHIVVVYPKGECGRTDGKKSHGKDGRSQPFSELLSNEFDFKACLIWTVIAVIIVIGLVRLIKCGLDRSERRSERYRITQQEKVMKDIEEYFSRANTDKA